MAGDQLSSSMSRFRAKFLRRSSSTSPSILPTPTSPTSTSPTTTTSPSTPSNNPPSSSTNTALRPPSHQRKRLSQLHRHSFVSSLLGTEISNDSATDAETLKPERTESPEPVEEENNANTTSSREDTAPIRAKAEAEVEPEAQAPPAPSVLPTLGQLELQRRSSKQESDSNKLERTTSASYKHRPSVPALNAVGESTPSPSGSFPSPNPSIPRRPSLAIRRQSLVPASQQRLIRTLLDQPSQSQTGDYFSSGNLPSIRPDMVHRKVWVKRLGSSATLVPVTEEDLVDDLRDVILKKYTNSLGKSCDAPDLILRLIPREQSSRQMNTDRLLGPEEPVGRTLDAYYPGGQTINEALIIEILSRRTPKPSPRQNMTYCNPEDLRPGEAGDYFSPMPPISTPPHIPSSVSSASGPNPHIAHIPSMSVIATGQVPNLPSPGSRGSWHQPPQQQPHRPKYPRQHTTSPTIITTSPPNNLNGMHLS